MGYQKDSFYQGALEFISANQSTRNRNRVHIRPFDTEITIPQIRNILGAAVLRNPNPKRIFLFNDGLVEIMDSKELHDARDPDQDQRHSILDDHAKVIFYSQEAVIEDVQPAIVPALSKR